MSSPVRKKLIEVALPLEAINRESVRESYIYKGNPSAVHKWWAQRPLAACRAVLFAQLVDDPSSHPDQFLTEEAQDQERQRLFRIIEELVKWENSNNELVLERARAEIRKSCGEILHPCWTPSAEAVQFRWRHSGLVWKLMRVSSTRSRSLSLSRLLRFRPSSQVNHQFIQ
jgi:putative DNA methylase